MADEEETTTETEPQAKAIPPEQEDRIVDKVVNKIKEIVLAPGEKLEELTEDEDGDEDPVKEPTTVREIENDMEAQVRAQLKKIRAEEDHAAEHEKLKQEPEREPVTVGKVTRALWGNG